MPRSRLLLGAGIVGLLALLPLSGSTYLMYLSTQVLIFALFATSLNILIGYAGLVSFGHAAFFAIGGYGCAILLRTYEIPLLLAMPAALVMTAVLSALIGSLCVRLTSYYFSMLTLAFGQLVWAVVFKWRSMTGGDDGILRVISPSWIDTPASFFIFTLLMVTLAMLALWIVAHSPLGRTLMAIRENQVRAGFLGVHTRRVQLVAFTIAGTFAGLAGALFALFNRSIFPDSAWWLQSAEVLIMVVLGGMNSFFGPMVGALTLIVLSRFTLEVTAYWPGLLAIILLATLFFFPNGIAGLLKAKGKR
ncbi:branched-chain amino acid ABC transporter permease [Fodinicurvata sediminis]|uniref:branched-chain amino acid ABC transporter permease n=1 Tax=Fodinicurvata sediminis TaxID=1121832 RepID=UPI0004164CE2|nr:branched-chain amino acid ABC transporter permease [Fodinicurvata sediminis]